MERVRSIEIPESLYNRMEARIKGSNFGSVSEYVSFILRERLTTEEEGSKTVYSKEDEEKIKSRLKDLGYL
ncbi:MAG: CopG family transcriptional regulator, partial [Candidatus Bathyarchaeia archaeon]|jgi:Arc/MetJ-type ribon-helix-helix transcriptional regulator